MSGYRRLVRSAFALPVFHRNEQFGAEPGNRRGAGLSLLDRRCLRGAMSLIGQLASADQQKQQPARGFDSYGLVACLVISLFFIVWITLASKSLNVGSVVFLLALPWVLLRAGAIVTSALRFPSFFALDFLLGVAVVQLR